MSRPVKKRLTWARVRGVMGTGEVWLLRRVISAAASGARSLAAAARIVSGSRRSAWR